MKISYKKFLPVLFMGGGLVAGHTNADAQQSIVVNKAGDKLIVREIGHQNIYHAIAFINDVGYDYYQVAQINDTLTFVAPLKTESGLIPSTYLRTERSGKITVQPRIASVNGYMLSEIVANRKTLLYDTIKQNEK